MSTYKRKTMNKAKLFGWLIVLALIAGGVYYANEHQSITTYEAPKVVPSPSEQDKLKDEIRKREDIKKQQELIVQETYLTEQKKKAEAEKAAAIAKYDEQIAGIEKELEAVRAEKLSFQ